MALFNDIINLGHEGVYLCSDPETGLKAIIAIHNTVLGPALGGTRMWHYEEEEEAMTDVLRLSRGMTYKASISGLQLGGGKAVIIGEASRLKNQKLMHRFGQFVNDLAGKYITAEDVNMSEQDMVWISQETKHVTGLPISMGGNGDPSPVTAYTTYLGMKAAVKVAYGNDTLQNKKVLVQGLGNVGTYLIELLSKEGAKVLVSDIFESKIDAITSKFDVEVIHANDVMSTQVDVYAPCALGATVNSESLKTLNCAVIAGAANNQLAIEDEDGLLCMKKGIIHAPDFLINSGGLINVCAEYYGRSKQDAMSDADYVYNKTIEILTESADTGVPPQIVATAHAEARIKEAKQTQHSLVR